MHISRRLFRDLLFFRSREKKGKKEKIRGSIQRWYSIYYRIERIGVVTTPGHTTRSLIRAA